MNTCSASILAANRSRIAARLPDRSVAIFPAAVPKLRNGDSDYPYCQNKNLVYLTGYEHPGAIYVMLRDGSVFDELLFIEEISEHDAHWFGYRPAIPDVIISSGIQKCSPISGFSGSIDRLLSRIETCYVDYHPVTLDDYLTPEIQFLQKIQSRYPHLRFQTAAPLMHEVREQKQEWEIERICRAIDITRKGIMAMLNATRPGLFEYQLQAHLIFTLHYEGCTVSFQPIIAAGPSATVLHYTTLNRRIEPGHLILLDVGAEFEHYSADITRTIPASGCFSDLQRGIYSIVLEANKATIEAVRPGITFKELNAVTRKVLTDGMLRLNLIKDPDAINRYFTHGVSHMLGLDTHDVIALPGSPLKPGAVITVEPGLYLPDLGIGIRIEDDVLVTQTGHRNLSATIPKEIDDIERLMRDRPVDLNDILSRSV